MLCCPQVQQREEQRIETDVSEELTGTFCLSEVDHIVEVGQRPMT
jgi:hypothetical protein